MQVRQASRGRRRILETRHAGSQRHQGGSGSPSAIMVRIKVNFGPLGGRLVQKIGECCQPCCQPCRTKQPWLAHPGALGINASTGDTHKPVGPLPASAWPGEGPILCTSFAPSGPICTVIDVSLPRCLMLREGNPDEQLIGLLHYQTHGWTRPLALSRCFTVWVFRHLSALPAPYRVTWRPWTLWFRFLDVFWRELFTLIQTPFQCVPDHAALIADAKW